jgi:ribosomal protein S18 acetylase RimI-like enzyme
MQQRLHLREYVHGDASSILRLHGESEHAFEELDLTEDFIDHIARREDFRFYIATLDGSVIGFCGVLFYPSLGRAEVGPIAVDHRNRRAAVGRAVYEMTEAYLKGRDIRRLTAKVKAANTEAVAFFTGLGFTQEGFFREYTQEKEDVIQYVKFI